MEQKCFDLRSLSPALSNLWLLLILFSKTSPHWPHIDSTWTPHRPYLQLIFQHSFVNSETMYPYHHRQIFIVIPPPPPPLHFLCFPSTTTTTFLLFLSTTNSAFLLFSLTEINAFLFSFGIVQQADSLFVLTFLLFIFLEKKSRPLILTDSET